MSTAVDNLVGAISDHQPELLRALRRSYPAFGGLLVPEQVEAAGEPGIELEGAAAPAAPAPASDETYFRVDLCIAGLSALNDPIMEELALLRRRMHTAAVLQSVAEFLAVIGSSAVLVVLSQSESSAGAAGWITAALATLGSVFAFLAGLFQRTSLGGKTVERHAVLVEGLQSANRIKKELHIWRLSGSESIDVLRLVKEGDTIAEELREALL